MRQILPRNLLSGHTGVTHTVASAVLAVGSAALLVILLVVGLPFDSEYVWLFWLLSASIVYQGLWAAWGIQQLRTSLAPEIDPAGAKTPIDSPDEAGRNGDQIS